MLLILLGSTTFPHASVANVNPNVEITIQTTESTKISPHPYIYATNYRNTTSGQLGVQRLCPTWETGECRDSEQKDLFTFLPACESGTFKNCVSAPEISVNQVLYATSYMQTVGQTRFPESADGSTPAGSGIPIYKTTNQSEPIRLFAVIASQKISKQDGITAKGARVPVTNSTLSVEIAEVELISGVGITSEPFSVVNSNGSETVYIPSAGECIAVDGKYCFIRSKAKRFSAKLSMNVDSNFKWLHGRVSNMEITSEKLEQGFTRITIKGDSIRTFETSGTLNAASLPKPSGEYGISAQGLSTGNSINIIYSNADPNTFKRYTDLLPYLRVQNFVEKEIWSIKSMSGFQQICMASTPLVIGGISTNSIMYDSYQPRVSLEGIDYSLSSPHEVAKGEVFSGFYELVMSEDAARCFYNLNSKLIKAEVSITDEGGSPNVATTTFKQEGGFLKVTVAGFHFSSPRIRIKLTNDTLPVSAPTIPQAVPQVKKTISCKNGKKTKTITGYIPKCPKGFKKIA